MNPIDIPSPSEISEANRIKDEAADDALLEDITKELANSIPWHVIHSGYHATLGELRANTWKDKDQDDWAWIVSRIKGPMATVVATGEANTAIEAMIVAEEYMNGRGNP